MYSLDLQLHYCAICALALNSHFTKVECWARLKAIGYVVHQREISDKITTETGYYLFSSPNDVQSRIVGRLS